MQTTLGVNVDHIATLREARKIAEPDPLKAALICQQAGAHGITIHLREDRRHIQDHDLYAIKEAINIKLNLEMANVEEIVNIALKVKPDQVTIVPEKRNEITTEGGLDVCAEQDSLKESIKKFQGQNIITSLFIDPQASKESGAEYIEIHTGCYANAKEDIDKEKELVRIKEAVLFASDLGLGVNAGHGLNYVNVGPIACIEQIEELNIGHAIIAHAVFVGLENAVKEMLKAVGRKE